MARRLELNFPNAINDPADLYDRLLQLALVQETVRAPGSRIAVILGERRTGKSSLLRVVRAWARKEPMLGEVFLPREQSRLGLMVELLEGLAAKVDTSLERLGYRDARGRPTFSGVQEFVRLAGELTAGTDQTYVVCLDELDSMLKKARESSSAAEANKILEFITYISDTDLPLKFVFTLTRMIPEIMDTDATPFTEVARIAELTPWSADETRELAEKLIGEFFVMDTEAHELLAAAGGGHPYFIKAVLHSLLSMFAEAAPAAAVSAGDMQNAVAAALTIPELNTTLPNIVKAHFTAAERALLHRLAAAPIPADDPALPPEVIGALVRRHYVRRDGDHYALASGLFAAWLQRTGAAADEPHHVFAVPAPADPDRGGRQKLRVDEGRRRAFVGDDEIRLSPQEFRFLSCVARHAGAVVDRQMAAAAVWADKVGLDAGREGALYALVRRLREKLGPVAAAYVETLPGFGFYANPADVEWIPGGQA